MVDVTEGRRRRNQKRGGGGSMHDLFPFFPHSFQHAGREFGPGLASALFMSAQHILRLNICWFVKSTNTRSCPSPWHISSADRKHCRTFNWWEPRLVTRTTAVAALPSLPSIPLLLRWRQKGGGVGVGGGGAYERGQRWAKAGLKVAASHCERTASRKAPLHLFVLTCLYVLFHLKVPTTGLDTEMDRKAGPGRHKGAICQNGATMLTAAVCVNISQSRGVKRLLCRIIVIYFLLQKKGNFSFLFRLQINLQLHFLFYLPAGQSASYC